MEIVTGIAKAVYDATWPMILDRSGEGHLGRVLLRSLLSLGPEVGRGGTAGEMPGEDGLNERGEDKLSAAE